MKIALWADNVLDPNMSGIGYHQAELLRSLDRLGGHDYRVCFTRRKVRQPFPYSFAQIRTQPLPGLRHVFYPMWHILDWPPVDMFVRDADLVHLLHTNVSVPTRRPAIVWVVDLGSKRFPAAYPLRRRSFKDLAVRRAVRNPMIHFTVNSQFVKEELCDLYDVDPERVTVVHLGVDHERFRRLQDQAGLDRVRQRYGLERPFVLFVGIFSPRKNLVELIQGVALFNQHAGEAYELVLAGASGWQDEAVFQASAAAGCVRLTGYIPAEDLPALYSLAQALVYPSTYEGFGLPLVEAMACGTPVIASSVSAIPEVVSDAGLLLPEITPEAIACTLEKLSSDSASRAKLVKRGLERASTFTWERAALRCRDLYEQVGQKLA